MLAGPGEGDGGQRGARLGLTGLHSKATSTCMSLSGAALGLELRGGPSELMLS